MANKSQQWLAKKNSDFEDASEILIRETEDAQAARLAQVKVSVQAQNKSDLQQQQSQLQHEMVQTKHVTEQAATTEIETINQQAHNALSVKVQENEQLKRDNERMMREAQLVIQRKEQETMPLKSEAELALHHADQHAAAIAQRKIDLEFQSSQDEGTIAELNRKIHKSADEMRVEMQADFKKQDEEMMANIQSQAQLEMQKEYASLEEKQQINQVAMNKQIFQLQTDLPTSKPSRTEEHTYFSTYSIRTKPQ